MQLLYTPQKQAITLMQSICVRNSYVGMSKHGKITDAADSLCFSRQNTHRACVLQKIACQKFAQSSNFNTITRRIHRTEKNVA